MSLMFHVTSSQVDHQHRTESKMTLCRLWYGTVLYCTVSDRLRILGYSLLLFQQPTRTRWLCLLCRSSCDRLKYVNYFWISNIFGSCITIGFFFLLQCHINIFVFSVEMLHWKYFFQIQNKIIFGHKYFSGMNMTLE